MPTLTYAQRQDRVRFLQRVRDGLVGLPCDAEEYDLVLEFTASRCVSVYTTHDGHIRVRLKQAGRDWIANDPG